MTYIQKILILAFMLATVFDKGSAIDCYDCTSVTIGGSDTCASPVSSTASTTCSGQCKTTSTYLLNSVTAIVRSCESTCQEANALVQGTGTVIDCCSTSLCNNADSSSLGSNSGGGSAECYNCNWPGDDNCLSPSSGTGKIGCASCLTTATYTNGALTTLARTCGLACVVLDTTVGDIRTATTCCDGSLCNNAVFSDVGRAMMSLAALVSSLIISIYSISF